MSADTFYTDKILDENFRMIREGFDWTAQGFRAMEKNFAHLEGHIGELARAQAKLAEKTKTRKVLPFVVGAVVGVYVYKKLKKNGMEIEFYPTADSSRQKPEDTVIEGEEV
jgi:hypothetical protein